MFQNRLKILLVLLLVVTGLLMLRALQLQVFDSSEWADRASKAFAPAAQLIETTRGRILDYKGREVAVDNPCTDLCVDYRAIAAPPLRDDDEVDDPAIAKWLRSAAIGRLTMRLGKEYTDAGRSARGKMLADEIHQVRADIQGMWGTIAREAGKSPEEIDETRRSIIQRVEMRRRYVWVHRWKAAVARQQSLPEAPWYRRWLLGEGQQDSIPIDSFDLVVDEQRESHVILADVGTDLINFFGKDPDKYPGLVLRPGIQRVYPYDEAGCHLIGHLSKVTREDLLSDNDEDELRKYWPNDLVGRTGVEALAEPLLRGSRGKVVRKDGEDIEHIDPKPGKDVQLTVDIELQREIQAMFKDVAITEGPQGETKITHHVMHGAAVVIDVATGEVRALASYPDYDLNRLDDDYSKLASDWMDLPLLNRATQEAREPGSTAKPMVGLAAITSGLMGVNDTVECNGYLVLGGRRYNIGRCWTAALHATHMQIPSYDPHPTGHLTFSDALERSCNVYFETVGDRLKWDGITTWFRRFGLGRMTGIGIDEVSGKVPGDFPHWPPEERRIKTWQAAIGQGLVLATPLQMANVAATIARDGIWVRPHLLTDESALPKKAPATQPDEHAAPEQDRVDLHLAPEAMAAAKKGMYEVVNALAGTGRAVAAMDDNEHVQDPAVAYLHIAGKTGTAQAGRIRVPVKDAQGNPVLNDQGKPAMEFLQPSIMDHPNPQADWYRADWEGKHFDHAWFIGYAPADHPKLAFAVMVEYGASGGATAGRVAKHVIEACVQHGYLPAAPISNAKEVASRD